MTETRAAAGGTLVLGGGFAGASIARELAGRRATVVSPGEQMVYTSLLAEAAAGEIDFDHVDVSLRDVCPQAEVMLGRATTVDAERRRVQVETSEGRLESVVYEQLVVTVGSVRGIPPSICGPGHAFPEHVSLDARSARNNVLAAIEAAAVEIDGARRDRLLTFLVVGGGYAGVEMAAQLHALARHVSRKHPSLRGAPQRWLLVEAAPRILAEVGDRLARYAHRRLSARGIEIRTSTAVVALETGCVQLADGAAIDAGTVVWAAGLRANPILERFDFPLDSQGRVRVDRSLKVEGQDRIWAAGDCAAVPNAATPRHVDPPTNQHALRQARRVAKNVIAQQDGRPPEEYRFLQLGHVGTLGRYDGIAELFGVELRGLPAWAIARAVHLLQFPNPSGSLTILNEWALSLALGPSTAPAATADRAQP